MKIISFIGSRDTLKILCLAFGLVWKYMKGCTNIISSHLILPIIMTFFNTVILTFLTISTAPNPAKDNFYIFEGIVLKIKKTWIPAYADNYSWSCRLNYMIIQWYKSHVFTYLETCIPGTLIHTHPHIYSLIWRSRQTYIDITQD